MEIKLPVEFVNRLRELEREVQTMHEQYDRELEELRQEVGAVHFLGLDWNGYVSPALGGLYRIEESGRGYECIFVLPLGIRHFIGLTTHPELAKALCQADLEQRITEHLV